MTDGALRMRVFAFIALVLFGGLVARLWYLQGLEAQREELQQRAQTNVLEEVYEEAPRGRILDRNGRVIVDNKVVEVVTIDRGIVDDLDPVERDAMFLRLAIAISRSGRLTKVDDIVDQYGDRSYGPFERVPVAVDVNPELLVFLGERQDQFPGVNVSHPSPWYHMSSRSKSSTTWNSASTGGTTTMNKTSKAKSALIGPDPRNVLKHTQRST